jgi:hypothetical protein
VNVALFNSRPATGPTGPPRPTPQPRAPLPPFDEGTWESVDGGAPAFHPVYTELPAPPAPFGDARWWRGDAWGVTVPGLPYVAGGAQGAAQSRVLTYFLDRYGREWEDRILDAHLVRGYTHFSLSPQDSFAHGLSLADYVAMATRVRRAGFHVHHLLRSKYYTAPTFDPADARPTIEALLEADALQILTPGWECNFWSPTMVRQMIDHDAAVVGTRCLVMLHFYAHYISWQENHETPTDFWKANVGKVDGVLYQCDPVWSAGMASARINDALVRLSPGGLWGLGDSGRGHPIDVVGWELIATLQFNNGHTTPDGRLADEDMGNLRGYELLCTPGPMSVYGFGNGARMPDGSVL